MNDNELDALVTRAGPGGTLKLEARKEFKGPLVLRKPIIIQGQNATIWAAKGPVLTIEVSGVVLQNLNVEITEDAAALTGEAACAVVVRSDLGVTLDHVAVRGNVLGLAGEAGEWRYPRTLRLGTLKANHPHTFKVRLASPVPCTLRSEITGLHVEPQAVSPGHAEVTLRFEPLAVGTRLRNGFVLLQTPLLTRRIAVTGFVPMTDTAAAVVGSGQLVYDGWDSASAKPPPPPAESHVQATPPPPPPEPPPIVDVAVATTSPASTYAAALPDAGGFFEESPVSGLTDAPERPSGVTRAPGAGRRKTSIPVGEAWSPPIVSGPDPSSVLDAVESIPPLSAPHAAAGETASTPDAMSDTIGPGEESLGDRPTASVTSRRKSSGVPVSSSLFSPPLAGSPSPQPQPTEETTEATGSEEVSPTASPLSKRRVIDPGDLPGLFGGPTRK